MDLLIATRNAHKLGEFRKIFSYPELTILGTDTYPTIPDPVEDGSTFIDNALIKAKAWAAATGKWALADDSGLCVNALDGAPGIYSARYAGEHGISSANNAKLLKELTGSTERQAHFTCALALVSPTGESYTTEATCEGTIIERDLGDHGFGYDPLFVPEGYDQTFAQLPAEVKNAISHRAKAIDQFKATIEQLLVVK